MLNIMNNAPWNRMSPEARKKRDCNTLNKLWKSASKTIMTKESPISNKNSIPLKYSSTKKHKMSEHSLTKTTNYKKKYKKY